MSDKKIFLCGLPESGKSTFLGAFWHVLNFGSKKHAVRLHKLHGDDRYINSLADSWVRVVDVNRTSTSHDQPCVIELENVSGDRIGFLNIPDISGEKFLAQWKDRELANRVAVAERGSSGICIFINPAKLKEDVTIADADYLGVIKAATGELPSGQSAIAQPISEWSEDKTETQVILVQLLLDALSSMLDGERSKVAVIISAWDTLKKAGKKPQQWLAEKLPMLAQTLSSNTDKIEHKIYGISALGGAISDAALRSVDPPELRIQVVTTKDEGNDITAPIAWLLGAGK